MTFARYMKIVAPYGFACAAMAFGVDGSFSSAIVFGIVAFAGFVLFNKEQRELVKLADTNGHGLV